jgi:hypothetical protein
MKYITKPKIKEAEQFHEGKLPLPFSAERACCLGPNGWYVVTTHGQETKIVDGDYIVREPDGNGFYPCKPDIFESSHDEMRP